MTLYDNNILFLKKNAPKLYRTLTEETPLQNVLVEKVSKKDNYIIESPEAKCFMHSLYDIENETKMMLKNVENNVETIILFGMGNGYALKYILDKYENLYEIIVIEPSLQIFKKNIEDHDFSNLFKSKTRKDLYTTFIVNKSETFVVNAIYFKMIRSKNVAMVYNVSYCSVFNSYYNNMATSLSKLLKVKTGDIRTFAGQWKLWLLNSIKNYKAERVIPIEKLRTIFKDKTAVIVSAGPSLNKNIHLIKKLKEKAIIFAVGSSIKILESRGIIPHFRVAIDAFPAEKKAFDGIDTKTSSLILGNQLYYEIIPEYKGNKVSFILESDYLGKYIYNKVDIPYSEFLAGSSVAVSTLNLLCGFECKRIIFMGQDFSYTKEGLHASGTAIEKEDKESLRNNQERIVKNIYGEDVFAMDKYFNIKYEMEPTIAINPDIEFLNATEGGVGIDGVINVTAQEVLDDKLKHEKPINLDEEIESKFNDENSMNEYSEKINNGFSIMKDELLKVRTIQNKMLDIIKKLLDLKQRNSNLSDIEREINSLEEFLKRIEEIPVYNEVIVRALQADILSIKTSFGYKGSEKEKIIESKEKIITNILKKNKEYIDLACFLIEDDHANIMVKSN